MTNHQAHYSSVCVFILGCHFEGKIEWVLLIVLPSPGCRKGYVCGFPQAAERAMSVGFPLAVIISREQLFLHVLCIHSVSVSQCLSWTVCQIQTWELCNLFGKVKELAAHEWTVSEFCLEKSKNYRQNTESLLSMNNIEICHTTA